MTDLEQFRAALLAAYHYDPEAGVFTSNATGRVLGCLSRRYMQIGFQNKRYRLHRLVWLYCHGHWPTGQIDHINGIKTDNRLCNLRDVTQEVNNQNLQGVLPRNLSCGVLGVTKRPRPKDRPYQAQLSIKGASVNLGFYATADEAHQVYILTKRMLHEGCTI